MVLQDVILVNKFGQGLTSDEVILEKFRLHGLTEKNEFLSDLLYLILQSKPEQDDIEVSIRDSDLKPTFTPCVLLRKGVAYHHLKKIIELPAGEQERGLKLLLSLFKVAYRRRFELEKNDPHKWWYWDLAEEGNVRRIPGYFS